MLIWIFLIISIVQVAPLSTPKSTDLGSIFKFINQVKTRATAIEPVQDYQFKKYSELITRLSCRINEATKKLDTMRNAAEQDVNLFYDLGETLDLGNNAPLRKIERNIERIKEMHGKFVDRWSSSDVQSLRNFIPKIIEPSSNYVPVMLDENYRLIAPGSYVNNGYGSLIEKARTLPKELCGLSLDLSIGRLHTNIVYVELLGFIMGLYAYTLKSILRNKSYDIELDRLEIKTKLRLREYLITLKNLPSNTTGTLFLCEYKGHHTRESTYVDFAGLHQGYLVNERDIAETETCWGTCNDLPRPTVLHRRTDTYNPWVYDRPCNGILINCATATEGTANVCRGDDNLRRRYDYISSEMVTYGKKTCQNMVKVQMWHDPIAARCDYCVCTCVDKDSGSKAIRAISFLWSAADYNSNKVVIGMRFIIKAGMLHLQAYEGKVMPGGSIEPGSERWVPLQDLEYREEGSRGNYYIGSYKLDRGGDYMFHGVTGTIKSIDAFALEDIDVGPGRAIAEVSFTYLQGSGLVLNARSVGLDIMSGKVDAASWWDHRIAQFSGSRPEFVLHYPGRPIDYTGNKIVPEAHGKWIRLQPSNFPEDAGQSTVPFFDAREVVANFPIRGIGMEYRGVSDGHTGGFLIPTLKTYRLSDDVKIDSSISQY